MDRKESDALVVFGATGDLAHKMIFPALYAMVKRDALKVPVIGVAFPKWSLTRLHKRVTDSRRHRLCGMGSVQCNLAETDVARWIELPVVERAGSDVRPRYLNKGKRDRDPLAQRRGYEVERREFRPDPDGSRRIWHHPR